MIESNTKIKEYVSDLKELQLAISTLVKSRSIEEKTFIKFREKYDLGDMLGNRDVVLDAIKEKIADIIIENFK